MPGPDKLSLIVFSGDYDRVHYALAMAGAAAATNRAVTLFFTMAATRALLGRQDDGAPGWSALAPAADGSAATARDRAHGDRGIATLEELLSACVEMGVQFRVCEMGLKAEAIDAADLRDDVPVMISGIVGFLGDVSGNGEMLFI